MILDVANCVKLLRSHGRHLYAGNFEAALEERVGIVANDAGCDRLAEAMDWITDRTWVDGDAAPESAGVGAGRHSPN